ncbi:MAG: hypothetical protein D3915_16090 [Candidatus Electrothrix sp. AU1_5]|nr:hypothetical protein [Candidatus Electrothrix gigas]MCI5194606.1 hypothetical protein [Candidatus Electrothrix gigas]
MERALRTLAAEKLVSWSPPKVFIQVESSQIILYRYLEFIRSIAQWHNLFSYLAQQAVHVQK